MDDEKRFVKLFLFILFIITLTIFIIYCYLGGKLTTKPIESDSFDYVNPAKRELYIESCGITTVKVIDLSEWNWRGVRCILPDREDVNVYVYLSKEDVSKIAVGDTITVGGRINYLEMRDKELPYKHTLFIGSAIVSPPFSFYARLKTISHEGV